MVAVGCVEVGGGGAVASTTPTVHPGGLGPSPQPSLPRDYFPDGCLPPCLELCACWSPGLGLLPFERVVAAPCGVGWCCLLCARCAEAAAEKKKHCANCRTEGAKRFCSTCKKVVYCNRDCQVRGPLPTPLPPLPGGTLACLLTWHK